MHRTTDGLELLIQDSKKRMKTYFIHLIKNGPSKTKILCIYFSLSLTTPRGNLQFILSGSNTDLAIPSDSLRLYSSMPVLEDGLSSGHASDTDNNNPTVMLMKRQITEIEREINQGICKSKQVNNRNDEKELSPKKDCISTSPNDVNGCVSNFGETHLLPQMDSLGIKTVIRPNF